MGHGEMFGYSQPQHGNPSNTHFQQVPSSYGFFPSHSTYGAGPSHMFGTPTMTPPFAYTPGPSSLMPFYPPPPTFQKSPFPQPQQDEDDSEDEDEQHQHQPPRRPIRPRRRPPCGT